MNLEDIIKATEALRAVKGNCVIQAVNRGTNNNNPTIILVASPTFRYVYECNTGKIWTASTEKFNAGDYTHYYIN